ncbi:MAG TPA: extracellular solute-binding protein, partial [Anaerolineales bacterium]|nr:extracellular solute-binding protein [Anaerolineales bacterium]
IWNAYHTGGAEEQALSQIVDNAKTEYPDLTINVLNVPFDQIFGKYQNEVAAGAGPDMFVAPNDDLGNWARSGIVAELDSYLEGNLGAYSNVAVEGMKVDGKIYGVPESAKAVALYYNTDLIAEAPATSEELLEAVAGGARLIQNQNGYHLFGWFPAFGGQLMDGTNTCIADQGGFGEAMTYLVQLKEAGAEFFTDGGAADTEFRSGNAAMIINGPWVLGDYQKDIGDKLGVAPIPAGPGGAAGPLNGIDGFYINPNSQNIESAVELALFLTNAESSQIYSDVAGHVPIRSDVTAPNDLVGGFAQASATGFPRPQSQEFGNYWGPFGDMVTKVMEGQVSPAEGVFEACKAMNEANSKTVASESPVSGELTIWNAYHTGGAEEQALNQIIESATERYPDLTINVLNVPFDQIFGKYQNEVAAGGGPDMYVAPNDDLGNWARSGIVAELDSYLAGRLGKVSGPGVEGMKVDGKIYGVPESAKAVALYYNTDLIATPPATTEELLAAVEGGARLIQNQNGYHLFGWFPAFGGQLMDASGKCVADQQGFAEAMQFQLDLKAAGAEFFTDGGAADTEFRSGNAAMIINGPWVLGDYAKDLGDKLGVAPIPAGSAGPAGPLNGIDGFYINPNSQNVAAAVELALFLTNAESSSIYTEVAGHVPIRSDVTASDPDVAGFALASATGFPRPQSKEFGNYWGPFGDMVTKVLEGTVDPATGVADACKAMNEANGK